MKMIRDMKIGKKMRLSFAIVLVISTIASIYALYSLKESQNLSQGLYEKPYVATTETMGICKDVSAIDGDIMGLAFTEKIAKYKGFAEEDFGSISKRIEKLDSCFDDRSKLSRLKSSVDELRQEYENVCTLIANGDIETVQAIATTSDSSYGKAYYKCVEDSTELYNLAEADGIKFNNDMKNTGVKALIVSIVLIVISVVVSLIVSTLITNNLARRIEALTIMADKMSKGDFDF
ncbi:MCP four helix bundle domain-containing protein [Romboutsia sp.]|uniref:MCP four helix bundle domain-containing protein n=1 Tax=Romboutsia sp. TaxID=1965302 RepID=UPI002CBEB757|nr:MCP four helix bundle domain-containing protein [Romboutsia sp.]HSQ89024.1 MCP four helix bundle domain-containing protein [Romboutsia sp.]